MTPVWETREGSLIFGNNVTRAVGDNKSLPCHVILAFLGVAQHCSHRALPVEQINTTLAGTGGAPDGSLVMARGGIR